MAINFPNSPTTNDTFTSSGKTWYYTGTTWTLTSITSVANGGIGTAQLADGSVTLAKLSMDIDIPSIMGVY
jgi:hypothetical protein